jgi:bidirectional [NiFe] hydrogenase diaphorase subunit
MTVQEKPTGHPSGDERFKNIDRTIKRLKNQKGALLEVLIAAQESFGFLSESLLIYVSRQLEVPLSKVYGVATFYHMFSFKPLGENNAIICAGTACYVKGSEQIEQALTDEFHIGAGETTPDGAFSLTRARCLGSCGLAPMVVINGEVRGKETPASVVKHVKDLIAIKKQ